MNTLTIIKQRRLTACLRFASLTQIAPFRSATSDTPKTLCEIANKKVKRFIDTPKSKFL